MPRGDGTGPAGMGPMTGRAAGYCAGYPVPGFANPYQGRGFGMGFGRGFGRGMGGRGRGMGRGRMYPYPGLNYGTPFAYPYPGTPFATPYAYPYAPGMTPEQEIDLLKTQAETLQNSLGDINTRIEELESEAKKEG